MVDDRSVHDNSIYAYVVACEARSILLCTEFTREDETREFTDVLFSGVVAHDFEHVLSGNILFGIERVEPDIILREWRRVFDGGWKFGWPIPGCETLDDLSHRLRDNHVRGFAISASLGLNGWVLAQSMTLMARNERRVFL